MAIAIEGTGTRRSMLARVSTWPLTGFMLHGRPQDLPERFRGRAVY